MALKREHILVKLANVEPNTLLLLQNYPRTICLQIWKILFVFFLSMIYLESEPGKVNREMVLYSKFKTYQSCLQVSHLHRLCLTIDYWLLNPFVIIRIRISHLSWIHNS